jgi:hypothetical protein
MSAFDVEIAIEKLTRYKSPGTDEVLVELNEAWGEQFTLRSTDL